MEITQHSRRGGLELRLVGRMDANWADHVGNAIETAIRAGLHAVDLNFAGVDYISSAGIRILLKYHKQLKSARGVLRVVQPAESVLTVLKLSGIAGMLVAEAASPAVAVSAPVAPDVWQRNGTVFEVYEQRPGCVLDCFPHGRPEKLATGQLSGDSGSRLCFDNETFGLGLGAFGKDPAGSRGRYGEFLAVGGAAITQPTDGSSVPDFQITQGQLVPEANLLYGLTGKGSFARLFRFESSGSQRGSLGLAELVEGVLENLQTNAAGFAILAESSGVVGAHLRQSPDLAAGQSPWTFPGVRDWISFTTERSDERNLVLIVGFAERLPPAESSLFLRPLGKGTTAQGHFHAVVFPYRPLPKGNLDLKEAVAGLMSTESARSVLHLLPDEREFEGVGQTDLMRGACWAGPLRIKGRTPEN